MLESQPKYKNVTVNGDHIEGQELISGREPFYVLFSASEKLLKIRTAFYEGSNYIAKKLYDLQDGYGEQGFVPVQGYDWSGIRDSSPAAINAMVQVAEQWAKRNHREWEWQKPESQVSNAVSN